MQDQGSDKTTGPRPGPHDSEGESFSSYKPFVDEHVYGIVHQVASYSVQNTLCQDEVPDLGGKAGEKDGQDDNEQSDGYTSSKEGRPSLEGDKHEWSSEIQQALAC